MNASGKFVLRMSPQLHQQMRKKARSRKTSLNQLIIDLLSSRPADSRYIEVIRGVFGEDLIGVILFGSSARGEQRESSDVDLLIVLRDARPIDRSLYRVWDESVQPVVGQAFSPQFVHLPRLPDVSSLWLEVAMEGEILDDHESRLKGVLRRIRAAIADGLYRRKLSHGHPYWVRNTERTE